MWDADLVSRVRDRKLNEIMIFASMAKIDSARIDDYIDIIVSLGDDIDACDTLLETSGDADIVLDCIEDSAYLDRLSPGEMADEGVFNSMKSSPETEVPIPEDIADYVRQLISDAVQSIKEDDGSRDALDALKEELAIVRRRNEELSKDLDYRMTENAAAADDLKSAQEEVEKLTAQIESINSVNAENERLKAEVEKLRSSMQDIEELSAQLEESKSQYARSIDEVQELRDRVEQLEQVVSEKEDTIRSLIAERDDVVEENAELLTEVDMLDSAINTADHSEAPVEEPVSEETSVEKSPDQNEVPARETVHEQASVPEPVQPASVPEGIPAEEPVKGSKTIVDRILNNDQLRILAAARALKDEKIDQFIDMAMDGRIDETVCDNIVTFLKVDVGICDALLGMDYTDMESILDGFRRILAVLDDAPEPHGQKIYSSSLNDEEKLLEYSYGRIIEHVQDVMLRRYVNLL